MGTRLEDQIRDAVLAVRWKRDGGGLHPGYFVASPPESFQMEGSAASFLAHFIASHIAAAGEERHSDSVEDGLDKYSSEVIASYLEDQGYTVSLPD